MRRITALAALIMAALVGGPARGQAPDLRDIRIIIDVQFDYEEQKIDSGEEPFRTRYKSSIWLEAVQGKLIWYGHSWGCMDPDHPDMSLIYARGTHAGKTECPPYRSGTASNWTERSAAASYRTRLDIKGNVLTLSGEMSGTYTSETLHCGRDEWTTDGGFSIVQSLSFRLTGQACEVISARVVEERDEIDEDDVRKITTRISTAGPGFSCKVVRRSDPVPESDDKLVRFSPSC
ncbi:MAG: hypothetical protein AB7R90_01165 [Reyranellaceae bacterium]